MKLLPRNIPRWVGALGCAAPATVMDGEGTPPRMEAVE